MQREYNSPILKQLCDQQIRFAPTDQKLQQVAAAERLIGEVDPQKTYTYEYVCFRITGYRPESFARTQIVGEELVARSASVRRRSVGRDRSARRKHRRASADGRRAGEAIQRFDEDHFAMARAGPGEPSAGVRRSQARRLPAQQRRSVREEQPGSRGSRFAVQPTDGRTAPGHHRPGAPHGERRRLPIGDFASLGEACRAQRGNDSHDDPPIRQAAS